MTDRIATPNPLGPRPAMQRQARPCPCCGGWPVHAAPITDRYGWSWSLHTCYRCGVQYQARPMTPEAAQDFYASGRYRQVCAAVTGKPWDDPAYLRTAQLEYADLWEGDASVALRGRAWLDFGGSTGVVSKHWAGWGTTVTVADYGDGATVTPEQSLAVPDGTYDAILCCQSLDHLPEPLETLRAFLRVAKPGARLFCDVVKREHTALKIDHTVYFPTATSYLSLLERAGWRLVWLDSDTNPTHYSALMEQPQ